MIRGLAAMAFVSCTGVPDPCANLPDAAAAIELGSVNPSNPQAYSALADGDAVYMVPGNQGGQHIWIQVHARSVCPTHPRVRVRVIRASDGVLVGFSQFAGNTWTEVPGAPGTYTSTPFAAAIDADRYCTVIRGGTVRVEVQVDDTRGRVANAAVGLVIQGWAADSLPADRAARDACCADVTNTLCWPSGPPDAGD